MKINDSHIDFRCTFYMFYILQLLLKCYFMEAAQYYSFTHSYDLFFKLLRVLSLTHG